MPESRLCDRCQEILSVEPDEGEAEKEHYAGSESFIQAAEQGCYICKWVWREYRWSRIHGHSAHKPIHHTMYDWKKSVDRCIQSAWDMWQLNIDIYATKGSLPDPDVFWGLEASIEVQFSTNFRTKLDPSMRSKETFSLARQWISECCSEHVECRVSINRRKLPTRLVCVQSISAGSKLTANICRGDTLPTETPYLTLSHCWGNTKFLTTTRANLSSFEISLPIDRMSRTFQDAFFATVNLGFQHIWIDSLCIVQDDEEDWKRESPLMHEVYRNASCNVSASGFVNGEKGFLLNERRIDPTPVLVSRSDQSSMVKRSAFQDDREKAYYLMHASPWRELRKGPIYLRAWTLQEQLLATRAVHFGEDQVYWECKRTLANEIWPRGWLNTPFEGAFKREMKGIWQFKIEGVLTDHLSIYKTWSDIVSDYSCRSLTFASDRLPALAGITNEFANHLGDENIYGLWSKNLHCEILFSQMGGRFAPRESRVIPTWQDSPSWSWAALHKPVCWNDGPYNNKIHYLCDIDLLRLPGTIQLRLCGMLMQCPKNYDSLEITGTTGTLDCYIRGSDNSSFALEFWPDQWFDSTLEEFTQWQHEVTPASTPEEIDAAHDLQTKAFLERIVIMPILYYKIQLMEDRCTEMCNVMCLLLQAQLGAERGVYRRVGTMKASRRGGDGLDFDTIKLQLRACQRPLDHHLFQEAGGDGNYRITVM